MSPIWCQRWPKIPEARNMAKNEAHGAKTAPSCSVNQKLGLHTLHAPPPHPPRAKLHQLLALFQRFPSSKNWFSHAPCPLPSHPLGQSYINSLCCSSAFRHQLPSLETKGHRRCIFCSLHCEMVGT